MTTLLSILTAIGICYGLDWSYWFVWPITFVFEMVVNFIYLKPAAIPTLTPLNEIRQTHGHNQ